MRSLSVPARLRKALPGALLLLVPALAVPSGPAASPEPSRMGCEPGGPVDLAARVLAVKERGSGAVALVELTVDPRIDLVDSRITARRAPSRGVRRLQAIPDRDLPLVRGLRRRILYEIEVPAGRDHDIFFTATRGASGRSLDGVSAHVRIRLDPAKAPRRRAGAIEYRATVAPGRPTARADGRFGGREP